ncbi:hypothetical protein PsYK624_001180 [Phanerochaete sordida]|uniref:Uncharacterized protein n=1 Tax=Phanerochaete sordida TaxID=48140 RepID=A0A9P3L7I9_9APHY|nr:hypothetical protein PsYK624_001180 [Phanerochaete sordida]
MLERERATIQFVGYLVNHEALDKGKLRVCLERLVPNLEDAAHDEYSVQLVCELLLAAVPRSWANLASYTALIKQARNGLQLRVSSVTYTLVQDVLQLRSEWVANDRRKRERKKKAKLEKERRGDANLE